MPETIIERLRRELTEVPGLSDSQRDLLTSEAVIARVMPILSVITKAQVEEVQKVKDVTGEKVAEMAAKILKSPDEVVDINQFMKEVQAGNFKGEWVEQIMVGLKDNWFWAPIMSVLFSAVHIITTVSSTVSVSSEKTRQSANRIIRPYILDLETLMKWYFRQPGNEGIIFAEMEKLGISDARINKFIEMQYELLPIDTLGTLYVRNEISDDDLEVRLTQHKYKEEDRKHIKTTMATWPGIQDLVRFAVREVFSPELAASLGLYQDLPDEFLIEARKAGMADEYSRMFWGAHWTPPALTQSFAMFHRGVIDRQGLEDLLRINDYVPNYRDKLVEIAYNPLTRVDIRRIYEDRFIDFDELVSGYMDLGYSEENATLLSHWVDKRWGDDRRDLTRTDVLRMYDLGAYTRVAAKESLVIVGYNEYEAEELLLRNDLIAAEKEKKSRIRVWKKQYLKKDLEKSAVVVQMRSYGMQTKEIDLFFTEWDIDLQEKTTELTNAEIKAIFKVGYIDSRETFDRLVVKGYNTTDAGLLVALWEGQTEQKEGE